MPPLYAKQVQNICRRHPIVRLRLFGSRARGTAKPGSDYDFLVDFSSEIKPTLLDLGRLQSELSYTLKAPVDLIANQPQLPKSFLKDAKTVFERN